MNCLFRRVLRTRVPRQSRAADHRFCIRATYGYGRSRRFDPPPARCRHARSAHFSDAYDVELAIERAHAHIVRPVRASHAPEGSSDCTVAHRTPRRNPRTAPLRIVRPMRVSRTANSDPGRVNSLPHPPRREAARLSLRWQRARAGNLQTKARLP